MQQTLPLPKYHSVYLVLKERLRDGVYDERVPGELELMEEFGVSRATVRKALENLALEGLIERAAGRGTRRVPPPVPEGRDAPRPSKMTGLLDNLIAASLETTVKVIEHEYLPANEHVAKLLQVDVRSQVLRAVRVRSIKAGPVSHITTWVPREFAGNLGRRQLGRKAMLVLMEESGVEIGRARQTISARQADASVAALLGMPLGSALLSVNRLVYDVKDRPVLWLQGLYCPDRYEYEMELSRVGDIDAKVWVSKDISAAYLG
ncbi:GntR family transcriptional regulator [Pigmentiphaga sp.]|jgi:Transcriptional regulators|uniref:GntR family transcriptional regulator n=1 Tax=Pigmentiphaga sp. TaxID=1977564 RepID=UPI0025DB9082|nr:GntR family transcriptional regulator [Pigmentiphaga sp.]MBX6318639.1 GntR family transcriptional regulator [Pigmentiphaga sp.]